MRARYENKIKMALEMQCSGISASDTLKQRIDQEIGTEVVTMKKSGQKQVHFRAKKFVIGVAAACLLIAGSAAAGKTAMYISGMRVGSYSYAELDKVEQKLGFDVDVVESFENGYRMQKMEVGKTKAADEKANTLYTFLELNAWYEKGSDKITLNADKRPEKDENTKVPNLTAKCGDIALRYDMYTYKFVPEGYELTAEDKANMERDDYEISVGSDTVEYSAVTSVTWEKDGVYYLLMGMDTALTGEEMLSMAQEVIEAN